MKMTKLSHGVRAVIIARDPNVWQLTCDCKGGSWTGPTYESTEDLWRQHVWSAAGRVPKPMGEKTNRWVPTA